MAPVSRPSRASRTSAGRRSSAPEHQHSRHEGHDDTVLAANANATALRPPSLFMHATASEPPTKKRRLDLRLKQSTLDAHLVARPPPPPSPPASGPLLPPADLGVERPHRRVVRTTNGARRELDLDEDELALSLPSTRHNTPRPDPPPPPPTAARHSNGTRSARATATPQPTSSTGTKLEDKRSLRSHDEGPRLKSELATYFPNYEEIIFDTPKESEFFNTDSAFYIIDDDATGKRQASPAKTSGVPQQRKTLAMNGCPSLNLDFALASYSDNAGDPLSDEHFFKAHRKAERREKQMRNIEKEHAMHEKVQLDRLLEGLLGHDWLRVMGISGVTDTEARKFEPKRDFFIAEVQALVDKFKSWKEEEKRQRLEREEARRAEEEDEDDDDAADEDQRDDDGSNVVDDEDEADDDQDQDTSDSEPPSSDLNSAAARQLKHEAAQSLRSTSGTNRNSSSGSSVTTTKPRSKVRTQHPTTPFRPPSPPLEPIKSFYAKRHLREAALKKARQSRSVTAFGHPLPDMHQREFALPRDFLSQDMLKANAREKRARRRRTAADGAGAGTSNA